MKNILILLSMIAPISLFGADATGTWTGSLIVVGPSGLEMSNPAYFVLKQNGTQLTGTAGPNANEQQDIVNGKAEDGNLSFEVTIGRNLSRVMLRQESDDIKGTVTSQGRTGRMELKRGSSAVAAVAAPPSVMNSTPPGNMGQMSVQGVWRVGEYVAGGRTSHPTPGFWIFTEKYYSMVMETRDDVKRPVIEDVDHATAQQLLAMWGPFGAQFGTYEIKGEVLTLRILAAKNPELVGTTRLQRFKVDRNTLTTEPFQQMSKPVILKMDRVE